MAIFSWVMIGIFVAFLGAILLLGLYSPRSGADVLGWRATRSPETEGSNEADDIAQMLAASNALRRRRGAPERTEEDVAGDVDADRRALDRRAREQRGELVAPPASPRTLGRAQAAPGSVLGRGKGSALAPSLRPPQASTCIPTKHARTHRRNH